MRAVSFIALLVVLMALTTEAQMTCRRKPPAASKDFKGQAHICVYDGDFKVHVCTREKYSFTVSRTTAYECRVGNQKVDGWVTVKDMARVMILPDVRLVTAYPAKDMYKNIRCIGFYTAAVVNPSLSHVDIDNMFNKLVNCHLTDVIKSKAAEKAKAGIGLVADILGAVPNPYTIGASLLIKTVVALASMAPDPRDNDWLKFLEMHYIAADIKVKCRTLESRAVATCLRKANTPVTQSGSFKFSLVSCTGTASRDSYIKVKSDGKLVLTTHASFWSSSPLYRFCTGSKESFTYTGVNIKASSPVCVESWERNTGTDQKIGDACVNQPRELQNTVKVKTKAGEINLVFQLNRV